MVEAFPWDAAPSYLVRDNDGAYGQTFKDRVRPMGIRDRPISPRSPCQNPYVERLIGTLRRDCLDHVLIFGERHLRRVLTYCIDGFRQSSRPSKPLVPSRSPPPPLLIPAQAAHHNEMMSPAVTE